MALAIPSPLLDAIRAHGEREYPRESCGLLLGAGAEPRRVTDVTPLRNANTEAPERRFALDPREHLGAQREARRRGLEVVGFYHSHPDHPARPSVTDLAEASWPGFSYVITAVARGRAAAVHSYELAEDRGHFIQEEIIVTGQASPIS